MQERHRYGQPTAAAAHQVHFACTKVSTNNLHENKKQTRTTEKKQPGTSCRYDLGRRLTRRHSTHGNNENSSKFHPKTPSFRTSVMAATKLTQVRFAAMILNQFVDIKITIDRLKYRCFKIK